MRAILATFTLAIGVVSAQCDVTVSSMSPANAALGVTQDSNIVATFTALVDPSTVTTASFTVRGQRSGIVSGSFSFPAPLKVQFDPDTDFLAGESIEVTLSTAIQSACGTSLVANVSRFFVAVSDCTTGNFADSGQLLGGGANYMAVLGDVDGDGDLDAVIADKVWLNDDTGVFTDSGQILGQPTALAIGDVDGDGDLDVFIAVTEGLDRVWLNDGAGSFSDSGQGLGDMDSQNYGVALGDIDGDGDLDALVTSKYEAGTTVFLNDGAGHYIIAGPPLRSFGQSVGLALGDLDGDGDLDVFSANGTTGNQVWLNDGTGDFTDSGQVMPTGDSDTIALGDLDGDGDLDAIASDRRGDRVWLNDGAGYFTDSGQTLAPSTGSVLGDVDGDGDLDSISWSWRGPGKVWLNDGTGNYALSGQTLAPSSNVALGDLDRDGDIDAFLPWFFGPTSVWMNGLASPCELVCSDDIVVAATAGECSAEVSFEIQSTGECEMASIECAPASGSVFMVGATLVSCSAVDFCGDVSECQFTVTVQDLEAPVIECNSGDLAPCAARGRAGSGSRAAAPEAPSFTATASDNCGEVTVEIIGYECQSPAAASGSRSGGSREGGCDCAALIDGATITILDPGPVGTVFSWTVQATDSSGNQSTTVCEAHVVAPAAAGSGSRRHGN